VIQNFVTLSTKTAFAPGQVRYGTWGGKQVGAENDSITESVVVSPVDATTCEIHCHGGTAAVERLIADLSTAGVLPIGSFADLSLWEQEAQEVLIGCRTARTAAIAMDQVRGAFYQWLQSWASVTDTNALEALRRSALQIVSWGRYGVRLSEPFRVVLVGPPNVGKSTLLNAIVGWDRSITSHLAGTTRDRIDEVIVLDGLPIRISDTAGIRPSDDYVEQEGIRRSHKAVESADVVVLIESVDADLGGAVQDILNSLRPDVALLKVVNKADRLSISEREHAANSDQFLTVATTGEGIKELERGIVATLETWLPLPGSPVPITSRWQRIATELSTCTAIAQVQDVVRDFLRA
jgi:tRNA modification GTPase